MPRSKRFYDIAEQYGLPTKQAELMTATKEWARSRAPLAPELAEWACMWPLPIGRSGFVDSFQNRVPWSLLWAFEAGLPFDRSEAASFVKTFFIEDTTLVFFGLSEITITEIEEDEDGDRCSLVERRMTAPAFVISGANPATNDVRKLRTDLAEYWKGWEGFKFSAGPGRPVKVTDAVLEEARLDYVATFSKQPTREQLWAHLLDFDPGGPVEVSRSTIYRRLSSPSK